MGIARWTQLISMKFKNIFRQIRPDIRTILDDESCWNWLGQKSSHGDPIVQYQTAKGRKSESVQRVIWKYLFKQITKYWVVCNSCENDLCCRPSHMYLEKKSDIVLCYGVQDANLTNRRKVLTVQQASEIRFDNKLSYSELAQKYKCSKSLVHAIKKRLQWKILR
jgi:hypothetical protein